MSGGSDRYDVIIAGGGVAGAAAAVAAARGGARTLLVEREPALGGLCAKAMLREVCGLYRNGADTPPSGAEDTLNPGLQREVAGLLMKAGSPGPRKIGRVYVLPFEPGVMTDVLSTLVKGEAGLTLKGFSRIISARAEGGSITSVEIEGMGAVEAGAFVDATGNAELALMAGAATEMASKDAMQLAGYTVRLTAIAPGNDRLNLEVPYYLRQAADNGAVPDSFRYTQFSCGDNAGEGFVKFSVAPGEGAPEAAFVGFGAESSIDRTARAALEYLVAHIPALEDAEIAGTSEGAAQRDGRRAIGEYMLTADDIRASRHFEDEVCVGAWPMELWEQKRGPVYEYPSDDAGYGVPEGCLRARGLSNLFLAGRSLSATREAMGSLRVMGACVATGEQAGIMSAAASCSG